MTLGRTCCVPPPALKEAGKGTPLSLAELPGQGSVPQSISPSTQVLERRSSTFRAGAGPEPAVNLKPQASSLAEDPPLVPTKSSRRAGQPDARSTWGTRGWWLAPKEADPTPDQGPKSRPLGRQGGRPGQRGRLQPVSYQLLQASQGMELPCW